MRDYRGHHYVSHVHIGIGGTEEKKSDGIQEEDRDLPLRVGDPAVISAASGYAPLIAERLPPVAIADFSKTVTEHFPDTNSQHLRLTQESV